jgi:hypothetical protein
MRHGSLAITHNSQSILIRYCFFFQQTYPPCVTIENNGIYFASYKGRNVKNFKLLKCVSVAIIDMSDHEGLCYSHSRRIRRISLYCATRRRRRKTPKFFPCAKHDKGASSMTWIPAFVIGSAETELIKYSGIRGDGPWKWGSLGSSLVSH